MNVVMTVASLAPKTGGPARTVPSLAGALQEQGCTVEIVALALGSGQKSGHGIDAGIRVTKVPCLASTRYRVLWAPRFVRAVEQRCVNTRADILHDNGLWLPTNHAANLVARRVRIPYVVTPRGMLTPWALSYRSWKKRLAWNLYQARDLRTASLLHATSEEEARNLRALGLQQPIAVIPNGVELMPHQSAKIKRPSGAMRTVLFLSRIHPKKGITNLVKAWDRLRPVGWRVLIAGPDEGGHKKQVEAAIRDSGLQHDFSFVGHVDGSAKWDLYRSADLFVLPTLSENFGVVVAEALACGVPVITTKGAPWQDLVKHRCGWWVDIGVEPLVRALDEAMASTDMQRYDMGQRGRQLVEKKFTWPRVAQRMKAVYEWILGGGTPPEDIVA